MKYRSLLIIVFFFLTTSFLKGQNWKDLGTDEQFELAKQKAFNGQREEAREILNHILQKSPDYHDVRILLGRTYAWDARRDLARAEFLKVLEKSPENLDAFNAYTDAEMWDEKYEQALAIAERGLKIYPNNLDLLYKKADILHSLQKDESSLLTLRKLLTIDPSHQKGNRLLKAIKLGSMKYTAGVSYGLDIFNRTFDPAHYASAQLGRTNSWGSSIFRVNFAHRFETNGLQPEIDLYPAITNGVYAYLNYGYSSTDLFPEHRIAAEIYTKLPKSFEASAGLRYLYFDSNTKVTIYTGTIGWYIKNYWLSIRPYITPDKAAGTSASGIVTLRRYFKDAETYLGISAGFGFSPDLARIQTSTGLTTDAIYVLSQRGGIALQKLLRDDLILNASLDLIRQELIFDEGNYVTITSGSIGVRKKF